MNSSDQPAKQSGGHHNQAVVLREGDWVCYHCNNLNFSFRKKCNRCKNQTKEQNEQIHSLYHLAALAYEGANLQEDCGLQECLSPASPDSLCILNPQRPGQSKSYSSSEMQQACSPCHSGELGWQLFFSSDQEIWEQNSLSDSSAEYEQEDVEVDYHIQQMVTKLII